MIGRPPLLIRSVKIPQCSSVWRRGFTSSLFATGRNPKIVPRTDLQFYKASPTENNLNRLMEISHQWSLMAMEHKNHATDIRMKRIFDYLAADLNVFNRAVRFDDIGFQGRSIYLSRNKSTKKIESVVFVREHSGSIDMSIQVICANPNHIPYSLQSINQSTLEGADSFLFRMIVKYGACINYGLLGFDTSDLTKQGCKNIIFQSNDPNDNQFTDEGRLVSDLKDLDFQIHGKHATRDEFPKFPDVSIKNLSATPKSI